MHIKRNQINFNSHIKIEFQLDYDDFTKLR